jgi:hypothetical protein
MPSCPIPVGLSCVVEGKMELGVREGRVPSQHGEGDPVRKAEPAAVDV